MRNCSRARARDPISYLFTMWCCLGGSSKRLPGLSRWGLTCNWLQQLHFNAAQKPPFHSITLTAIYEPATTTQTPPLIIDYQRHQPVAQPERATTVKTHPFAHLTRLKVEVQLKSCAVLSDDELDTTPWCDTFHPLFGLFLESLEIHFIAPTLPNMRIYRSDVSNMYEIVSRVFDFIEIMNSQVRDPERPTFFSGRPDRHKRKVTRFLKAFEKQVCGFTRTKGVSAKAICFSWDCQKVSRIGSPANMMGPVWSHNLRLRDFPGEDKQTYFRVRDVKGYAGEMWIASSRRWAPTSVSLPWLLYNRTSKIVLLQMKNLDFGEAAQILSKVEI